MAIGETLKATKRCHNQLGIVKKTPGAIDWYIAFLQPSFHRSFSRGRSYQQGSSMLVFILKSMSSGTFPD